MKKSQSFYYKWKNIIEGVPCWPHKYFNRIRCFLGWLPILWNDCDWDYVYLFIIIKHKLKMMRKHHEQDKVIASWKKVASEIEIAELCLERLINDDYCSKEYKTYDKKYPIKWETGVSLDSSKIYKSTVDTAQGRELKGIAKKENDLRMQDIRCFGKILTEHIFGWWS